MHAPKDLGVAPLKYSTHLCNNIPAVLHQSQALLRGIEKYSNAFDDIVATFTAQQNSLKRWVTNRFHEDFQHLPTTGAGLRSVHELFNQHSIHLESFTRHMQDYNIARLRSNKNKCCQCTKDMLKDLSRLEEKREELSKNVDRAKQRYWKKSFEHREVDDKQRVTPKGDMDVKLQQKMNATGKDMKDSAAHYAECVEKYMAFLPKYNQQGESLLHQFEANDRTVLEIVKESVFDLMNNYSRLLTKLCSDVNDLLGELALDDNQDMDEYITANRLEPSPDPAQVYKFQLYDPHTAVAPPPVVSHGFVSNVVSQSFSKASSLLPKWGRSAPPAALSPRTQSVLNPEEIERAATEVELWMQCLVQASANRTICPTSPGAHPPQSLRTHTGRMQLALWVKRNLDVDPDEGSPRSPMHSPRVPPATASSDEVADMDELSWTVVESSGAIRPLPKVHFKCNLKGFTQTQYESIRLAFSRILDDAGEASDQQSGCVLLAALLEISKDGVSLASEFKDHPYLLEYKLWEDYYYAIIMRETDPFVMTPAQWRSCLQQSKDAALALVQASKSGSAEDVQRHNAMSDKLSDMLLLMGSIGADARLIRQFLANISEELAVPPERQEQIRRLMPTVRWVA